MSAAADPGLWAARYEEHVTRTAAQSARTLELYQEVMARVSRGELTPTTLQELMTAFVQARGGEFSARLTEGSVAFFSGLVELSTSYALGLVEATAPGLAPPSTPPPRLDTASWTTWFQQLNDYATAQGSAAATAYQSVLDRVASGELAPDEVGRAADAYLQDRMPEHLGTLVALCFALLDGLDDLRTEYGEEYLVGVIEAAEPAPESAPFAVDLVAPVGGTADSRITVANTRDEPSTVRAAITDVRRADGVGPAFAAEALVTPSEVELAPDEEATLEIGLALPSDRYEVGRLYGATLQVFGHQDEPLDVPLRIRAEATSSPSRPSSPSGASRPSDPPR